MNKDEEIEGQRIIYQVYCEATIQTDILAPQIILFLIMLYHQKPRGRGLKGKEKEKKKEKRSFLETKQPRDVKNNNTSKYTPCHLKPYMRRSCPAAFNYKPLNLTQRKNRKFEQASISQDSDRNR